jgi:hypothetical protein
MSNLLNAASLVVTPNSYKEGKLYSVIPNTGAGDFTFTRATTATRVNSDGLVELVPYNIVTLTADTITNVSGSLVGQQVTNILIGQIFTFSIYLKRINGIGAIILTDVNGSIVPITITNEWHKYYVTSTSTLTFARAYFRVMTTGDSVAAWGAQLVEGSTALPYQKTETRLNIPRIDYSLGGCPNILLEPQRTNLLLQSQDISSASWTKGNSPTITTNIATAPDGTVSADGIQSVTGGLYRNIRQAFAVAANSTVTGSVFVKKETSETAFGGLGIVFSGSTNKTCYTIFNAVTGTGLIASSTLTGTIKVNDYGNYWRLEVTTTDNGSNTSIALSYESTMSTNGTTLNPGAGSVRTLWGFQLEIGASYATSYIPTTTASVTRNADIITRNNIYTNGLITAAGGTWFVELRNNISRTRDAVGGIWIGDNTTAGTLGNTLVFRSGGLGRLSIGKTIAGSFTSLFTTATDTCKIAIKWNGTTADIFENGVKVIAATAFTPTNLDFLVGNGTDVPKYINEMALFPTPLTDEQCSILTSDSYPTAAAAYASLGLVSESPSCLTSTTTF